MKKVLNTLKYVLFLAIGIVMFYYVYRGLGIETIKSELKDLKWGWVWASFVFSILSHLSRAMRWNMLIRPLGYQPKTTNTFFAVMIMYATNLVIPRGGELARCTVLSRYEKIPFGKLVGTVVAERATDTLFLMVLAFVTIFSQLGIFKEFIVNNPEFGAKISFLLSPLFWIVSITLGILSIFILWKYRKQLINVKLFAKTFELLSNFFQGIISIKDLKNPGKFIFHSAFIYLMYFGMMYSVFFSYGPTSSFGPIIGLTAFIMGGLAMLAPVQGGIGAWHFMVIETLALYGLDKADGKIFALISHTSMNLLLIIVGVACLILLPIYNSRKTKKLVEGELSK